MVVGLLLDDGDPYLGFVVVLEEELGEPYFGVLLLGVLLLGVLLLLGELYRLPPLRDGGFASVFSEITQVAANKTKSASVKILRYIWGLLSSPSEVVQLILL